MNRLALVTGTSRGIGHAVAQELVEHGWDVVGIARHASPMESSRYRHLSIDLADVDALRSTIVREIGPSIAGANWQRIGLVNNAAVGGGLGPLEQIDPLQMARMSVVNWVAPTWLMGFFVSHVREDAALRIVNVSSGAAVRGFPGLGDYCGSKAALRMTTMSLATELDSDLRTTPAPRDTAILSYEPGTVDTAMQEEARTKSLRDYPWGQLFRDFHTKGALVAPSEPAAEIVAFLEADGQQRFTERRFTR